MQYIDFSEAVKNENLQKIIFDIFFFFIIITFAQNIDRGASNEYPQSMFWSKNKKK